MARETHYARKGPELGASASAPTAPHATPGPSTRTMTGPEKFWFEPWHGLIGAVCLVLSLGIHYEVSPWSLLPEHSFEVRDVAGELTIPVDVLQGDDTPPPRPEAKPPPPEAKAHPVGPGDSPDAGPPVKHPPRPKHDGGTEAQDGGPPTDAASGRHEDAAIAKAGQASGNVKDAIGMIGAAGAAQAGPQNVVVTINMAAIRTHPVGSRIGPLFAAIPQWDDFLVGTGVEPLRDTDWVSINGPSLIHSEKDVILVHYSAPDEVVDRGLEAVSRKAGNGGPYDAGVTGMKAVLGHADRADRVFMRPQPHVIAVVPPFYAATAARTLAHALIPRSPKHPNEALRMVLVHPHGPMPAIPETVTALRLWIVPRNNDGGADVFAEGDTATPEACREAVDTLKALVREQNSFGVKLITHGLLDNVELLADGPTVRMHLPISRDQLEVFLAFAAGRLGVQITPRDAGTAAPQ